MLKLLVRPGRFASALSMTCLLRNLCLVLVVVLTTLPGRAMADPAPILFTRLAFDGGSGSGTATDSGRLVLAPGQTEGTWTSPPVEPGFGFTRLVASWNADTPADSHLRVEVQGATQDGQSSDWSTLAIWAADDHALQRTSVRDQSDALGRIDTDTLIAKATPFIAYTLRLTLERAAPEDPSPSVRMLGAEVSNMTFSASSPTSLPLGAEAIELPVPAYSQ